MMYEFMQNALLAIVLAGAISGVVGSFIVVKKLVSLSGGIAHASYGGIGLGFLLGLDPLYTALPFSIISAMIIGLVRKETSDDTAIGIVWAFGMALGVLFISFAPGYVPDISSYLFGNILLIARADVFFTAALTVSVLVVVTLFYEEFQLLSFDEEFAEAIGVSHLFYYLLLALAAVSIVALVRVAGIVLAIAMLTLPPAIVRERSRGLKSMMISSALVSVLLSLIGLCMSYLLDQPSGATIVIVMCAAFLILHGLVKVKAVSTAAMDL
jgi:zinc transport system permease protein